VEQRRIIWDSEFKFDFEIGMAPEFEVMLKVKAITLSNQTDDAPSISR
jgi:hypothetical protein